MAFLNSSSGDYVLTLTAAGIAVILLLICYLPLGIATLSRKRVPAAPEPGKLDEDKKLPVQLEFQTPLPQPSQDGPSQLREPKLYRPFRHGVQFITMGTRKLDWNQWIEMDTNYFHYHDTKVRELRNDLDAHVKVLDTPQLKDAAFEVYEELVRFLTHKYPNIFQLHGSELHNLATQVRLPFPASDPKTALANAALLVQDDLIIMAPEDDGQYHLDAAAVCLPGFWRLHEKWRMSLDTLHIEAGVPHYEQKLQKSMNRFFASMPPEKPVTRNNYFIQIDDVLEWSHRMGDRDGDQVASWAKADAKGLTINDLYFRSERQTLRRLPRSGVLLFTVRTYFEPITRIVNEPHVPGRLASAIRAWDDVTSEYKGRSHWDSILLPYLDREHQRQVESGMVNSSPESEYPF